MNLFYLVKLVKCSWPDVKNYLKKTNNWGKLVSSDNVAKLEGEVALQNKLLANVKDTQKGLISNEEKRIRISRSILRL